MGNIKCNPQKICENLKSSNRITFIIIFTSILLIVAFCLNFAVGFIKEKDIIWFDFPRKEQGIFSLFFLSVILAPILETLLNQVLPYYLMNKIKYLKERSFLILLISALFFGLTHFYSLLYIIYAFILGFVFMYGYMIRIKTDDKTYYLITICHSLLNLGIFIKNLF
jgi:hypothetical protein